MDNGARTIAVIGTGGIGMMHLQVLRQVANLRPIAIPKRRERIGFLEQAGFATAPDLAGAVRMGAALCIIATDTGQHVRDGLSASEQGLDILVEKPLSTDATLASYLCDRAKQSGQKVFVGCVLRFSESLNIFRSQLSHIGRVHSVRIECQSYLPDWRPNRAYKESYSACSGEGGVLRDLVHEVDYAGWIFGWPKAVQAYLRNLGRLGIQADEAAHLTWELPDGCVVSVSLDYLSRPSRRYMRALGELGTLEWDGIRGTVKLWPTSEDEKVFHTTQTRDKMLLAQDLVFVEACRGIPDPQLATGEDGIRALAVCDAARRASAGRREETVEYP